MERSYRQEPQTCWMH